MSGLAQMLKWQGCDVSGSDRAESAAENGRIIGALKRQGIRMTPQDGSFARQGGLPDFLIYSTAIEDDNPDFAAAPGVERVHRAEALSASIRAVEGKASIAVTGSSGKTTVAGWTSEMLAALGLDPVSITGGIVNGFAGEYLAGNFRPGGGGHLVFEADESDRSLLAYEPDYAVILNIGTDHYSREELADVFGRFLSRTRRGAVVGAEALNLMDPASYRHLEIAKFAGEGADSGGACWKVLQYKINGNQPCCEIGTPEGAKIPIRLPCPGFHSAMNAAAMLALAGMLGIGAVAAARAAESFGGVWRRFDFAGRTPGGTAVYDDYAHNVEKICSCIRTAQELFPGRIAAVFQPHGFGPLKFMRGPLYDGLRAVMRPSDEFVLLPVYYAGGTAAFSPTSDEVASEYAAKGGFRCRAASSRSRLAVELRGDFFEGDAVLVMGARDNSLSCWAKEIARP